MDTILLTPDGVKLLQAGERIAAIRAVMNRTTSDLSEAKNACDAYSDALGRCDKVVCKTCSGSGKCQVCQGNGVDKRYW